MSKKKKYLATHIVHWPTGPVACCERHAKGLVALSSILGSHIGVTINFDTELECVNCKNEVKEKKSV